MNIQDRFLIQQVISGDRRAIQSFWEKWSSRILSFLLSSGVGSQELREDLAQEILYKVFARLQDYNPLYAPSTWIYTIARNHLFNHWRKPESPISLETQETLPSEINQVADLEKQDKASAIAEFVGRQPPEIRQIIYLHFYESLSIRAVAKILEKPYETIRYQVKKIKQIAKEELHEIL